jgi:hypothetical protein
VLFIPGINAGAFRIIPVRCSEVSAATSLLNEHLGAVPQFRFLSAEAASAPGSISGWDGMRRARLLIFLKISRSRSCLILWLGVFTLDAKCNSKDVMELHPGCCTKVFSS